MPVDTDQSLEQNLDRRLLGSNFRLAALALLALLALGRGLGLELKS